MTINLYCALVKLFVGQENLLINSCLRMGEVITNFLWKKTHYNIVYVNPYFVTPIGSNVKQPKLKRCAQCILCVKTSKVINISLVKSC